jgi:DHA2 family multidrug resistance protein
MLNNSTMAQSVSAPSTDRPVFAVGAVLIGSFIANFHSRIFSVGLPDLKGALSLSFDEGAWLSTLAMAPQILIAPAVVWLATVFGIRRVLIGPGLLYALISLIIPLTRDYGVLLSLSILHSLLLGTFVPATITIIFRDLPASWRLAAIALYALRVGFAQNFGVWATGFYMERLGWEWIYWQDIFPALLMTVLVHLGTGRQAVDRVLLKDADWGGMLLFGTGLAMIYAALDQGNRLDWFESGVITSLLIGGVLLVAVFFLNELLVQRPWASAGVLLSRNVGFSLVVLVLFTVTNLSNSSLVPNFLIQIVQLRPEQIGGTLLICTVAPLLVLVPLSIQLVRSTDARVIAIIGISSFSLAALLGTRITHEWVPEDFVGILLLQAVGQAFTLFPLIVIVLANSNPMRAVALSAYIQVVRLGSAEGATAVISTWLRKREQMHSNMLGKAVAKGGVALSRALSQVADGLSVHGPSLSPDGPLRVVAKAVQREANVLAYIDGFWLAFAAAIMALLFLALLDHSPCGPFASVQNDGKHE